MDLAAGSAKTVLTEDDPLRIEVPRDREGSVEPLLIPKHERRFTCFDDKIAAICACGVTAREIQGFLAEQYGTEVGPELRGKPLRSGWTYTTSRNIDPLRVQARGAGSSFSCPRRVEHAPAIR